MQDGTNESSLGQLETKEYFSIKEVSRITKVAPHILRYWEGQFKLLRPMRKVSGHRRYARADIQQILKVKDLLEDQGLTISGAKKYLQQQKKSSQQQVEIELQGVGGSAALDALKAAKQNLQEIIDLLR